ncbi:tyrosine-type recombinase/integrase [Nonomuraea wenchangensis]|uniref:tyrosine-type recombinase/integrase n=1 Tax=Nonomuraea wenchangensis TaxID=568860 RepID=UPI003402EE8A
MVSARPLSAKRTNRKRDHASTAQKHVQPAVGIAPVDDQHLTGRPDRRTRGCSRRQVFFASATRRWKFPRRSGTASRLSQRQQPLGRDLPRGGFHLLDLASLRPIRLHDLRHGAASLMLAAVVEMKVMQETLGHTPSSLAADTYTSDFPEVAMAAAEKTPALLLAEKED